MVGGNQHGTRLQYRRKEKRLCCPCYALSCIRPSVKTPGLDYQAWNCSGMDRQEILYPQGRKNFRYRSRSAGRDSPQLRQCSFRPESGCNLHSGSLRLRNLNFLTRRPSPRNLLRLDKGPSRHMSQGSFLPVLTTDPELFALYHSITRKLYALGPRWVSRTDGLRPVDLRLKAFCRHLRLFITANSLPTA